MSTDVVSLPALTRQHKPVVRTFGYGGSRLHCACGDERIEDSEAYAEHLASVVARAICTCTATQMMDAGHADGCPGSAA